MRRPPPSSRLPFLVTIACLAVFVAWLGLQFLGRSGHEPTRAVLRGVLPSSVVLAVDEREDHAYQGSAWQRYVAAEGSHVPLDEAALVAFADDIADDIGWWLVAETGAADVRAAERALWEHGDPRRLPLRFARALADRGVAFEPGSLLSRGFDPELGIRLDGHHLVHLLLHVAWRLDLDVRAVPAALHVYAVYRQPGGDRSLNLDLTRFADAAEDPDHFLVDRFHHRTPRRGAPVPGAALVDAAGLYAPMTDRDLDDEIAASVVLGLVAHGLPVDRFAALESRLEGTRSSLIVSQLHLWLVEEARAALARGSADLAALRAARAVVLRETHGALNLWAGHDERVVMGDAMRVLRADPAAMSALDRAVARGEGAHVCRVLAPLADELHALLPACP